MAASPGRLVFVGAVHEAEPALAALLDSPAEVASVITVAAGQGPLPAGYVDLEPLARAHGVPVRRCADINATREVEHIRRLSPDLIVVVGPEGGITEAESEAFRLAGATARSLGPTVLRTSTAGTVAAAVLLSRTGRWLLLAVEQDPADVYVPAAGSWGSARTGRAAPGRRAACRRAVAAVLPGRRAR